MIHQSFYTYLLAQYSWAAGLSKTPPVPERTARVWGNILDSIKSIKTEQATRSKWTFCLEAATFLVNFDDSIVIYRIVVSGLQMCLINLFTGFPCSAKKVIKTSNITLCYLLTFFIINHAEYLHCDTEGSILNKVKRKPCVHDFICFMAWFCIIGVIVLKYEIKIM